MTAGDTPADGSDASMPGQASERDAVGLEPPAHFVDPKAIGLHDDGTIALLVRVQVPDQPGVLHALTRVIFEHRANITYVDIADQRQQRSFTYFELSDVEDLDAL